MNIAVDVDGVLAEQVKPVLDRLNDRFEEEIIRELGRPMRKSDIKTWDEPIPGTDTNIKIEIEKAHEDPEYVLSMPVINGARPTLEELKSHGFNITIATSRTNVSSEATKEWLRSKSIPYDEYVSTNGSSKAILDAETLIDDYPRNVTDFTESGRCGILFQQPWNSLESCERHPRTYGAESWEHAKDILTDLHLETSH